MNDFVRRMITSRKELFWDKGPLDLEKDKFVIVERILEFGTERESQAVVSCYGDEFAREVVRNSRNPSPKTVNYFGRKYAVGEEIFFQLKKSLIYFDDAERDLNVNMYATDSGRFERLADDTWRATKRYFKDMVMTGIQTECK